jgi:hypothetical protein
MVPVGSGNRRCAHRDQRAKLRVYTFAIENRQRQFRDNGSAVHDESVAQVDFSMRSNSASIATDSMHTDSREIMCKI